MEPAPAPAPPANAIAWLTTDKVAACLVLGALGYLVVLRTTFRGSVI